MDVFEAINVRRSIRKYRQDPVEEEKLNRILEAGRLAPSAANRQPWHFIVVTDPAVKEALRVAHESDWSVRSTSQILRAPVVIVVCADPEEAWTRSDGEEYWKIDVAIAMQNMVLSATEMGLGTCWIAAFNEESLRRVLGIPSNIRIVALTPIGYPAEAKGKVSDRKTLNEIIHYNHW
ncbi:MAG: nitroreductase family protein [Candidatus Bathyarchaeia archaeon]